MIGFKEFLLERADERALEMDKIKLDTAVEYASKRLGKDITKLIPGFEMNFKRAQKLTRLGKTQRKDMPRIRRANVWLFQRRLMRGALDVKAPFAPSTNPRNPFPQGLSGEAAKKFLTAGFKDGDAKDDVVKVKEKSTPAGNLKPIQRQIYFDHAIGFLEREGIGKALDVIKDQFMVKSSDNFIIDGHHRWLVALLLDPSIRMKGIEVDMPIEKLLKLSLAYGDAIGNTRNK